MAKRGRPPKNRETTDEAPDSFVGVPENVVDPDAATVNLPSGFSAMRAPWVSVPTVLVPDGTGVRDFHDDGTLGPLRVDLRKCPDPYSGSENGGLMFHLRAVIDHLNRMPQTEDVVHAAGKAVALSKTLSRVME